MAKYEDFKDNFNRFEFGKTYFFDKSGIPINPSELKSNTPSCLSLIKGCSRLKLPRGFKFVVGFPSVCFNLSNISCIKTPIVQKVLVPNCRCEKSIECEAVAGYQIKALGEVEFSVSMPVCPRHGGCFPTRSSSSTTIIIPANETISFSCSPKSLEEDSSTYIDWNFAFFSLTPKEDCTGPYLEVMVGVALEFNGMDDDDCDE